MYCTHLISVEMTLIIWLATSSPVKALASKPEYREVSHNNHQSLTYMCGTIKDEIETILMASCLRTKGNSCLMLGKASVFFKEFPKTLYFARATTDLSILTLYNLTDSDSVDVVHCQTASEPEQCLLQ